MKDSSKAILSTFIDLIPLILGFVFLVWFNNLRLETTFFERLGIGIPTFLGIVFTVLLCKYDTKARHYHREMDRILTEFDKTYRYEMTEKYELIRIGDVDDLEEAYEESYEGASE